MSALADLAAKAEYVAFIEEEWQDWIPACLSSYFPYPFAPHHAEHWDWVWSIEDGVKQDPRVEAWARGHGKSTSAEAAIVAVGARQTRKVVMYVCATSTQTAKHAKTIESMLVSPKIQEFYPELAQRRLSKFGHSRGWNGDMIVTAYGLTIFFVSLDCEYRGAKWDESRPDLFVLDEIDGKHDSPAAVKKKIEIITTSLLPAGAPHAITLFCQNLIHRGSIATQLCDGTAQFLAKRKVSGPIPALLNAEFEKRPGSPGHDIIAGVPTWEGMPIGKCQETLDEIGLEAFQMECQHAVKLPEAGAIYPMWSDVDPVIGGDRSGAHVISWSQFAAHFNLSHIPPHWKLARGQDWGATAGHPCVTTWMARAAENAPKYSYREGDKIKSYALRGKMFAYRELTAFRQTSRQIAEAIIAAEEELQEADRMEISITGHDNKGARDTYAVHHNLAFETAKPDKCGGITQMGDYLQIDNTIPHPFKIDRLLSDGTYEIGCPSIFYIVADEQLNAPLDDAGFLRHRQEYPSYHYDEPAEGEELHRLEPYAFFNDACDSDRMIASKFFPSIKELSGEEKFEAAMPEKLKAEHIETLDAQGKAAAWQVREWKRLKMEKEQAAKGNRFNFIYQRRRKQ